RRAEVLSAGRDQDALLPVDQLERARAGPLTDVASRELALAVERPRGLGIAPVSSEELGRGHQNLAVRIELDRHVRRHGADVAGTRIRSALAGNERPAGLGLSIRLAEVHAPRL